MTTSLATVLGILHSLTIIAPTTIVGFVDVDLVRSSFISIARNK